MSDTMTIAASGIKTASARFAAAAEAAAQANAAPTSPPSAPIAPVVSAQSTNFLPVNGAAGDQMDIARQMARMIEAKCGFRANIAVFRAADRMAKAVIDVVV